MDETLNITPQPQVPVNPVPTVQFTPPKSFPLKWLLIIVLIASILFAPIPYYVSGDKVVCLGIGICPKYGWNLGPSLWQRISGGFLSRQSVEQPSIPQPSSSPTPVDQTANWKTYINQKYGFDFKYPDVFVQDTVNTPKSDVIPLTTASFHNQEANVLTVNVYQLNKYKLIDNSGGFVFVYDSTGKKWIHDKTKEASQFVPQRLEATLEAYLYKSGDVKCSSESLLIPNTDSNYLIEVINAKCMDDNGNPLAGYYNLTTNQILSTFKFIDDEEEFSNKFKENRASARDIERKADLSMLLNTIYQYSQDNQGTIPSKISGKVQFIRTDEANICSDLIPKYFAAMPQDPSLGSDSDKRFKNCSENYDTGYTIVKDQFTGKITLKAPFAEQGVISVTK